MEKVTPSLLARIASYSAAAGVVLAAAPSADAQIVHTDVDPDEVITIGNTFAIDVDNDGTDDFDFVANTGGASATTGRILIRNANTAATQNALLGVDAVYFTNTAIGAVSNLSNGASIGPVSAPQGFYSYGIIASLYSGVTYYNFVGSEGYAGFQFIAGDGQLHYGWARVSADNGVTQGTLLEYAYESTPDTPILAGAMGTAIDANPDGTPGTHNLSSIYPNPFNPQAQFTLEVAQVQDVSIAVYDALGRQVAMLHDGTLSAGSIHEFQIDGANLPSGVYVVRAVGEQFTEVRQVTLTK